MTKKSKHKLKNFDDLTTKLFQKDSNLAEGFLKLAFEEYHKDGDEKVLLIALRQVTIAKGGFSKLAKETGLSRESLYTTLSENGNPQLNTFKIILEKLGYALSFKKLKTS
jgi:probable addiction module antidote protein